MCFHNQNLDWSIIRWDFPWTLTGIAFYREYGWKVPDLCKKARPQILRLDAFTNTLLRHFLSVDDLRDVSAWFTQLQMGA